MIASIADAKPKYKAVCRIPGCGYFIARGPLDIPVIVGPPGPGLVALAEKMGEHLRTAHPAEHMQLAQSIQFFMGYLTLSVFELEDPRLQQEYQYHRSVFHRVTAHPKITQATSDEVITEKIREMEFDQQDEQELLELFRDFRDLLTEQGNYAPDTSDQKLVRL